jgi:hypothetical protein
MRADLRAPLSMNLTGDPPRRPQRVRNLALAAIAAQAGCFTLVIVTAALLAGLWLDAQAGQRGPFTIGLLIASIPISLFGMLRIALGAVRRIGPPDPQQMRREDADDEEDEC